MKKIILILGILIILLLVGCVKEVEIPEEIPEVVPEPVVEEEIPEEVVEEVIEPVVEEEVEEVEEEPVVEEEEKVSSEIVKLEIDIGYEMTNDTQKDEATLDKIKIHIKNIKYTRDYPRDNLWVKAYTSKDGEEERILWMDDVIEKENIRYGMLVTMVGGRGGYIFKDNVVIDVEVYDNEDILLATASKTVVR